MEANPLFSFLTTTKLRVYRGNCTKQIKMKMKIVQLYTKYLFSVSWRTSRPQVMSEYIVLEVLVYAAFDTPAEYYLVLSSTAKTTTIPCPVIRQCYCTYFY